MLFIQWRLGQSMSDTDTFVCHVVVWTSLVRTHFGQCGGYRTIFQDCMWQHVRGSLALVAFEHFTSIESTSKCRRILHLFFEPICALLLQWQEWFGSFFSVVFLFFFLSFLFCQSHGPEGILKVVLIYANPVSNSLIRLCAFLISFETCLGKTSSTNQENT